MTEFRPRDILILALLSVAAGVPFGVTSAQSLDKLLKEAEQELQKAPVQRPTKLPDITNPTPADDQPQDSSSSPLPKGERASAALIDILSLEKAAAEVESRQIDPIVEVKVAVGFVKLRSYTLEKDDDTFTSDASDWSPGLLIGAVPYQRQLANSRLRLSMLTTLSYFQNDLTVRRAGVVEGVQQYQHNLIEAAAGPMLSWNSGFGTLLAHIGIGITVIEQDSSSASDSIMTAGTHSIAGLGYAIAPFKMPWSITFDYIMRLRGIGGSSTPAQGEVVALGFNMPIRG